MEKNRTPVSIFVVMLGILLAPALQAKAISQKEAMEIVQNLPEVRAFQKEVETSKLKGKFIIYSEETGTADPLHEFYVGESLRDHTNRWNTFAVDKKSGAIFVMDRMKGKYLPYASWKKTLP